MESDSTVELQETITERTLNSKSLENILAREAKSPEEQDDLPLFPN